MITGKAILGTLEHNDQFLAVEQTIVDEGVQIAIAVLKRYADGSLTTNHCDALDEAIDKAYRAYEAGHIDDWRDSDYETPLTQSW